MKFFQGVIAAAVAVLITCTAAQAAIVTYGDRASWEAAAGAFTETSTFPSISNFQNVTSLTLNGGTTLSFGSSVQKRVIGSGWATWSGGYTGDVFEAGGSSKTASITPLGGFGLEMEPDHFTTFLMTLLLSDGSILNQIVNGSGGADFFGWVGEGVTAFTLSTTDTDFAFGRFVEASAVPEPSSLLLLLGALGVLGSRMINRRQAA